MNFVNSYTDPSTLTHPRYETLPIVTSTKNHCTDDICSRAITTPTEEDDSSTKDFSYITLHKQKSSQLEIYIQYNGPDISLPEKMELLVNEVLVNITQGSRNQWIGTTDVVLEGCSYYYVNIYDSKGILIRHPSYGFIITDGVGSCVRTVDALSYEKPGSLSFSLMLYVVLILCCVLIQTFIFTN